MADGSQQHQHPPHPEALDDVLDDAWRALVRGAADRKHAFHQPVLATVDELGLPTARTVVLRRVEPEARLIICHTDRRSPKVTQLERTPTAAWAFYAPKSRVQVRASGATRVEMPGSSALADQAWERTRLMSRRCYLAPHEPSRRAEQPSPNLPETLLEGTPSEAESEVGRANFAVVVTRVDRLDWLRLKHDGHRRALFTWGGSAAGEQGEQGEQGRKGGPSAPTATWLQP